MKILTIFGTRPEAIKMAPVVNLLRADDRFDVKTCVTAQHRQMLDQVLTLFNIEPDVDLDLMTKNQTLAELTSRVLLKVTEVLKALKPDLVLVQGDTTSAFIASLAAFYENISVGHIEAGLRTFNKRAPFPEETNRVLTSHLVDIHFAPTELAKENLLAEHIPESKIVVTGNTVIDSLFWVKNRCKLHYDWADQLGTAWAIVQTEHPIILITGHRRENFGEGFENICSAIAALSKRYPDCHFVYPVHLNPQVQKPVNALLGNLNNVHLIPPQEYAPFVYLMNRCKIILTDSGGIQEEAPSLGKPVLVMRENTERPEALAAGTVKLVGANVERIVSAVSTLIEDKHAYESMSSAKNPFGDGLASQRILQSLLAMQETEKILVTESEE